MNSEEFAKTFAKAKASELTASQLAELGMSAEEAVAHIDTL